MMGGSVKPTSSGQCNDVSLKVDIPEFENNGKLKVKRWKILTSALVLAVVILSAVLLFSTSGKEIFGATRIKRSAENVEKEPFTFDDIFNPAFSSRSPDIRWMNENNVYTLREEDLMMVNMDPQEEIETILVPSSVFELTEASRYYVSPDGSFVLLASEVKRVWRHSFTAVYRIYVVGSNEHNPELIDFPGGELAGERLQYAGWSENDNSLSFVVNNNLYYQSAPNSEPQQITSDGQEKVVFNGIADWNYEEDILSSSKAHYWSPDGAAICYAKFDATDIPFISFPRYGSDSDVYGQIEEIAYPKAGDVRDGQRGPNSKAELYVINTHDVTQPAIRVPPPPEFEDSERYYSRVAWRDSGNIFVTWTNRAQNHIIATLFNVELQTTYKNYEKQEPNGYVQAPQLMPHFIEGGNAYVTVLPKPEQGDEFTHVALVTAPVDGSSADVTFLTEGSMDVMSISTVNEEEHIVYYIATNGDPTERHLFRVGLPSGESVERDPDCLTCEGPDECRYVSTTFSVTSQMYVFRCQGPGVPTVTIRSAQGWGSAPFEKMIELNIELRANLETKLLPTREFIEIPLRANEVGIAEVYYPPGFDGTTKHPLFVYVYAGPNSQRVTKRWDMGSTTARWLTYLKSSQRVIVASIDGRGTIAQGREHLFRLYRNLGVAEIEDQSTAGEFLRDLDAVDADLPSAAFGWSYGGFAVTHLMGDRDNTFTCGLAVAPVASFNFYDTAYTERYMGFATEDDNKDGYEATDATKNVEYFHGKQYFIAHGTADDNVHYMNAAHIMKALMREDIDFRQYTYPDENHGINSPPASRNLLRAMTAFLENDCWTAWRVSA